MARSRVTGTLVSLIEVLREDRWQDHKRLKLKQRTRLKKRTKRTKKVIKAWAPPQKTNNSLIKSGGIH